MSNPNRPTGFRSGESPGLASRTEAAQAPGRRGPARVTKRGKKVLQTPSRADTTRKPEGRSPRDVFAEAIGLDRLQEHAFDAESFVAWRDQAFPQGHPNQTFAPSRTKLEAGLAGRFLTPEQAHEALTLRNWRAAEPHSRVDLFCVIAVHCAGRTDEKRALAKLAPADWSREAEATLKALPRVLTHGQLLEPAFLELYASMAPIGGRELYLGLELRRHPELTFSTLQLTELLRLIPPTSRLDIWLQLAPRWDEKGSPAFMLAAFTPGERPLAGEILAWKPNAEERAELEEPAFTEVVEKLGTVRVASREDLLPLLLGGRFSAVQLRELLRHLPAAGIRSSVAEALALAWDGRGDVSCVLQTVFEPKRRERVAAVFRETEAGTWHPEELEAAPFARCFARLAGRNAPDLKEVGALFANAPLTGTQLRALLSLFKAEIRPRVMESVKTHCTLALSDVEQEALRRAFGPNDQGCL